MSEYELLVRDALDARVPLRLDRRPAWDDVLARAGVARSASGTPSQWLRRPRRRRLALVLAVVALGAIVVGSALAALGAGPFGTVTSWLGYSRRSDSATSHVSVAHPNGTTSRLSRGFLLSWSPDGTRLLVGSDHFDSSTAADALRGATPWALTPEMTVDVVRADGSSDLRVIRALRSPGVVQWSPDSRTIAYDRTGVLYAVEADGSGVRRRLAGSPTTGVFVGWWSWSPGGRQIVYTGRDTRGRSGVYLVNTHGTPRPRRIDVRPLPKVPRGRHVAYAPDFAGVAWSPDGSRIAFEWDDGTYTCCVNRSVYVMRPDGSHATRLGKGCLRSWSPDGGELAVTDRVVFFGDIRCDADIDVMNADGTGERQVAVNTDPSAPIAWFPDGSKLAYLTGENNSRLVVVDADGSGRRLIAISGAGTAYEHPAWFSISPDGSTVAYVGGQGLHAGHDLYLVDADGSHRRLIARASNTKLSGPVWRPVRTP